MAKRTYANDPTHGPASKYRTTGLGGKKGNVISDASKVSADYWADGLLQILRNGDAILLGTTSDGGAIVATIMEGDARHRTYITSADELEQFLRDISQGGDKL